MSGTLITELEEGNAKKEKSCAACSCLLSPQWSWSSCIWLKRGRAKKDFKNHSSITNQFLSFHNTFPSFRVTGTNFENKGQQIPNWPHPPGKQKLITHKICLWHRQLMLQISAKALTGPGARTGPTTHGANKIAAPGHHDPNTNLLLTGALSSVPPLLLAMSSWRHFPRRGASSGQSNR